MKVIQINCVYKYGSTGKIVQDIHNYFLNNNIQAFVLYGRGNKCLDNNVYKVSTEFEAKIHSVLSKLFGVEFGFSFIATNRIINIIKKEKPDVVHLHCLNGHFVNVYRLLKYLKQAKIKTVLTLHAEIMHTAGCEHAMECEKWKTQCHKCHKIKGKISKFFRDDAKYCFNKMKNAFSGFSDLTVVGVSEWLTLRAKQSPIFDKNTKFITVNNGIDCNVFKHYESDKLRKKLSIPEDKKICLHITPNFNHPIKGGKYVLEIAKMLPHIQFIIVGFNGNESILPANILPVKHTSNQVELAEYYSLADLVLLTSKRETFSMVVAESLSCGTYVVGFKAGGPETIAIEGYSEFVEYGNVNLLKEKVEQLINNPYNKEELEKTVLKKYSALTMAENYLKTYQ